MGSNPSGTDWAAVRVDYVREYYLLRWLNEKIQEARMYKIVIIFKYDQPFHWCYFMFDHQTSSHGYSAKAKKNVDQIVTLHRRRFELIRPILKETNVSTK